MKTELLIYVLAMCLIGCHSRESLQNSTALNTYFESGKEWRYGTGVYWAGVANTYFAIDLNRKTGIVYFSNYFPILDEGAFGFYKLFGREEFSKILE